MKTYAGILIFVAGAATGAVGALFYLRKEFNKKVNEEITARDMAIRELKRNQKQTEDDLRLTTRRLNEGISTEISKRLGYSEDDVSALVRKEPRKDVVYSVDENGVSDYPREGTADIPYGLASIEDFLYGRKEYDKTTLTFYDEDGVLSTENGDVVEDIRYILGEDWQREVGRIEKDIAYIRNDKAGTDYEVIVEHKKYTEDWAT